MTSLRIQVTFVSLLLIHGNTWPGEGTDGVQTVLKSDYLPIVQAGENLSLIHI